MPEAFVPRYWQERFVRDHSKFDKLQVSLPHTIRCLRYLCFRFAATSWTR